MEKIFFNSFSVLLSIIILFVHTQSLSARPGNEVIPSINKSAFDLNEESLNEAMKELNMLEAYLDQNVGVSYKDLAESGSELIFNVSTISSPMGIENGGDDLLGIPPFLWGCILGWLGLLMVYILTDNDKEQVKKALKGCVVGTGVAVTVGIVFYLAFFSLLLASESYYY
jgi:hypothetical protein